MGKFNKKQTSKSLPGGALTVKDGDAEGARVKRYQFSMKLFCDMFHQGNEMMVRVKEGWPEDAMIVGMHPDELTYTFSVIVHSQSFDLVPNNNTMPYGSLVFQRIDEQPINIPVDIKKDMI